jgi:hypothetical protein
LTGWEETDDIIDYDNSSLEEFLQMLNQKYNKINGINFVWSNGVKVSQNENTKIESVINDFVFRNTSGDRLYEILNRLTGAGRKDR